MPEIDIEDEGRDILSSICAGCGMALYPMEVAGEIDGRFADYEKRNQGVANFVYCGECWLRFKYNTTIDMEDAVEKRNRLFHWS